MLRCLLMIQRRLKECKPRLLKPLKLLHLPQLLNRGGPSRSAVAREAHEERHPWAFGAILRLEIHLSLDLDRTVQNEDRKMAVRTLLSMTHSLLPSQWGAPHLLLLLLLLPPAISAPRDHEC